MVDLTCRTIRTVGLSCHAIGVKIGLHGTMAGIFVALSRAATALGCKLRLMGVLCMKFIEDLAITMAKALHV